MIKCGLACVYGELKNYESLHKIKFSFFSIDGVYTNVGHSISHGANLTDFFVWSSMVCYLFKIGYSRTFTKLLLKAWSDNCDKIFHGSFLKHGADATNSTSMALIQILRKSYMHNKKNANDILMISKNYGLLNFAVWHHFCTAEYGVWGIFCCLDFKYFMCLWKYCKWENCTLDLWQTKLIGNKIINHAVCYLVAIYSIEFWDNSLNRF